MPFTVMYCVCCRYSQYLLQFSKCDDRNCCSELRSSIRTILGGRFVNGPKIMTNAGGVIELLKPTEEMPPTAHYANLPTTLSLRLGKNLPFDTYCPSVAGEVDARICPVCKMYFPSKASMLRHRRTQHKYTREKLPENYMEELLE